MNGGEMSDSDKVRENRLRRMAQRQGLTLTKSRRRDPRAVDYGQWLVTKAANNSLQATLGNLDEVERFLLGE
jgi:hypothetical protein